MSKRELLAYLLGMVEYDKNGQERAIEIAKENGMHYAIHEGKPNEFFLENNDRTAEWLIGQLMDERLNDNFIVKMGVTNICHSFLEEGKDQ